MRMLAINLIEPRDLLERIAGEKHLDEARPWNSPSVVGRDYVELQDVGLLDVLLDVMPCCLEQGSEVLLQLVTRWSLRQTDHATPPPSPWGSRSFEPGPSTNVGGG